MSSHLSLTISWVCQYIQSIVMERSENPGRDFNLSLFDKAIGEFSLLAMLAIRHEDHIHADMIAEIQTASQKIIQNIEHIQVSREGDKELVRSVILLLLSRALKQDWMPQESICNILCISATTPDHFTLEYAYFLHLSNVKKTQNEKKITVGTWYNSLINILNQISVNGLKNSDLYNLTHLVFFATDFGASTEFCEFNPDMKKTLKLLFVTACPKLLDAMNWDLLMEVLLSLYMLSGHTFEDDQIHYLNMIFKQASSPHGWFSDIRDNQPCLENRSLLASYSIFHATLVAALLQIITREKNHLQSELKPPSYYSYSKV